jgi:hypothetical protein
MGRAMKPRYALGSAALMIGSAVNYFGDRLLGVTMEFFHGLSTFSGAWMADVFLLPFVVGLVTAWIFGQGGKWLCYFPPLIVRALSYARISFEGDIPPGNALIPMGWWGFFVILAMEAAAFGGIFGEVWLRKLYTRSEREKARDRVAPDEPRS